MAEHSVGLLTHRKERPALQASRETCVGINAKSANTPADNTHNRQEFLPYVCTPRCEGTMVCNHPAIIMVGQYIPLFEYRCG